MYDDQANDSASFIRMAAGVGITVIDTQADDADTLRKLRQILTDIQKETNEEETDREKEAVKPLTVYHCYQCAILFRNDPVKYAECLSSCVNP